MWNIFRKENYEKSPEVQALEPQDRHAVEKAIRDLQKKGLVLPISKETCREAFTALQGLMQAIECPIAFTFTITNREKGSFELLTYSQDGKLSIYPINVKDSFEIEPLLQQHAPGGVPLSQLEEVAGWLHNHGAIHVPMLSIQAIEKKLESLMRSCPHGAYMLHTQDRSLTLSRLNLRGQVQHLKIDLQKQLSCYTIEVEGKELAATRVQFKRKLQQMGTPIRIRTQQDVYTS